MNFGIYVHVREFVHACRSGAERGGERVRKREREREREKEREP